MNQQFYDAMEESPVIAAVKDFEGLEKCCRIEEIRVVFILFCFEKLISILSVKIFV